MEIAWLPVEEDW